MMPPRSILAAVDFSEPSRVALDFAARLQAIQQIQQQIGPQLDMLKVMMEGMTDEERIQMKVILSGGKREGGKP